MELSFGSVCSGIESASVAGEPLGFVPWWFSEIEAFPSAVLEYRFPEVWNVGDMCSVKDRIRSGELGAPDVLIGGTPCQAFSVAGLRKGLEDSRGQLTLEFVRILEESDNVRRAQGLPPSTLVWENVPGVLSSKDNAFGCFLGALAGEDAPLDPPGGKWANAGFVLGPARTIAWRTLDAQYFGVAQRRRRVFLVASAGELDPREVLFEFDGVRRDSAPRREAGQGASHDVAPCIGASGRGFERAGETRGQDPVVAVAPCLQAGGKSAGSATQQDAENGALVAVAWDIRNGLNSHGTVVGSDKAFTLKSSDYKDVQVVGQCATGDVFPTLRAEGFDGSEDGTGRGAGAVAVAHVEILPTMTSGGPRASSHNQVSGQMRDAYITPVALGFNARQDPDHWEGRTGPLDTDGGTQAVHVGMQVRRLTPTECERLQGFPDGFTRIPWRGKPPEDCPDGPRYKALGNSKAVPAVRWILRRLRDCLEACA